MLQLFSTGIIPLWLNTAGLLEKQTVPSLEMLDFLQLTLPDPHISQIWKTYISTLSDRGFNATAQGCWVQTQDQLLLHDNGLQPLPAASLTKVATSLAALKLWEPDHQFVTEVRTNGSIQNGVLQGDLVIVGGGDPLFVGPEATSLGHSLQKMGIQRVSGDLVITGAFSMDFLSDPVQSGQRLRQGFQGQVYQTSEENGYTSPPLQQPSNLEIVGSVQWLPIPPPASTVLIRHSSLPLYALLKQMNVNSNNAVAESLATNMGGASTSISQGVAATGVPAREILLKNGSGLGQNNRLSPRAVVALLQGIQEELQAHNLTIADVFPVARQDQGTIAERSLPTAAIVKTGTLWNVSALAGVIPTQKFGPVWFTIINRGDNVEGFRQDQDRILQQLTQKLGTPLGSIPSLKPSLPVPLLGDLTRNQVLTHRSPS